VTNNRPVSDETVDDVARMDVNNQYCVELGSIVFRQLRSNLDKHTHSQLNSNFHAYLHILVSELL